MDEKEVRKSQNFQNTNLLLEHYLDLKAYCDSVIYKAYMDVDGFLNLDGYEIAVQSIKANREITLIIMSHIDNALSLLKRKCEAKGIEYKYEIIEFLYLESKQQALSWHDRISLLSHKLCSDEITVRKCRNEMVKDLSVFLFGVEGLKL